MSNARTFRNVPQWLRTALVIAAIYVPLQILSSVTGFGDWLRATPAAVAATRVLGVLFFGAMSVLVLWGGRHDPTLRKTGYRLAGLLFLILAAVHAALLIGDDTFFDQFHSE
jgi:hypothetical protein